MEIMVVEKLIEEVRNEFQIPPYFDDDNLMNYVKEGNHEFNMLVKDIDYDVDLTARSLLKNYVFYAHNKKLDEFWVNYNGRVVGWQLANVGVLNEKDI